MLIQASPGHAIGFKFFEWTRTGTHPRQAAIHTRARDGDHGLAINATGDIEGKYYGSLRGHITCQNVSDL